MSKIKNLEKNIELKTKQVEALTNSISISNDLFKYAKADYFEVLMTQRDALEAQLELVETKKDQLNTVVNIYRDLGIKTVAATEMENAFKMVVPLEVEIGVGQNWLEAH